MADSVAPETLDEWRSGGCHHAHNRLCQDCTARLIDAHKALQARAEGFRKAAGILRRLCNDDLAEVSRAYWEITDGRISKPNTLAATVVAEHDDVCHRACEEDQRQLQARADALESVLRLAVREHVPEIYPDPGGVQAYCGECGVTWPCEVMRAAEPLLGVERG